MSKPWLPYNWDEDIAYSRAIKEGGELILSNKHFPVIKIDIIIDGMSGKKRGSKLIMHSEKVTESYMYDKLSMILVENGGICYQNQIEYQLAFLAFADGCRFVEVRPTWALCEIEEENGN